MLDSLSHASFPCYVVGIIECFYTGREYKIYNHDAITPGRRIVDPARDRQSVGHRHEGTPAPGCRSRSLDQVGPLDGETPGCTTQRVTRDRHPLQPEFVTRRSHGAHQVPQGLPAVAGTGQPEPRHVEPDQSHLLGQMLGPPVPGV